jgi:hypothetical protein
MTRTRWRPWKIFSITRSRKGWELVTSFQRTHKALQVGSTIAPVPGLVSTTLVFKRADA